MKSKYKYFVSAALSGLFGLLVAFSASAQHRGGGGGGSRGGGGFHGGGSFSGGGSRGGGFSGRSGGSFNGGGSFSGRQGGSFNGGGSFHNSPGSGSYSRGGSFNGGGSYSRPQSGYSSPRISTVPRAQSFRGNIRPDVGGNRYSVAPRSYSYGGGNRLAYSPRSSYGYRSGSRVSVGFGYRGGSFRGSYNHGRYYSYNPFYGRYAFYNRYYAPRLGFRLSVLPYGYYPFYWGDYQYFYSGGYYYQYDNNNYTVVEPPVGAIMDQLPAGAKSLMIDGEQYYELNGVYYQAVTKDDGSTGYQIAGKDGELTTAAGSAPQPQQDNSYYNQPQPQNQPNQPVADDGGPIRMGDTFDTLPPNCTTVKIDGQKYHVSPDGVYYVEDHDGNHKIYRVAGTPDDQPGN